MRRFEYTLFPRFVIAAESPEEADEAMRRLKVSHQIYVTWGSNLDLKGRQKAPVQFDVVARKELKDDEVLADGVEELADEQVSGEPPAAH